MVNKTSSYHDSLLESLTDPNEARLYLNAVLEDYPNGFLKALRNVAQARQMTKVAEQAGIKRESLYRALSDSGNPTLDTFRSILAAVGLRMTIATPHELATASSQNLPHTFIVGNLENRKGEVREDSSAPPLPNVVDIAKWAGLSSHGQKRNDEMEEESSNKPTLQEALCG